MRRKVWRAGYCFSHSGQDSVSYRKGLMSKTKVAGLWVSERQIMPGGLGDKVEQRTGGRIALPLLLKLEHGDSCKMRTEGMVQSFNSTISLLGNARATPLAERKGSHRWHWPQCRWQGPAASAEISTSLFLCSWLMNKKERLWGRNRSTLDSGQLLRGVTEDLPHHQPMTLCL